MNTSRLKGKLLSEWGFDLFIIFILYRTTTACSARLGLTDLRFPLMWKDTDHFKNRGDYRRFAVFCLAKVGTEVLDTSLVTPVDRSATDITFPDALVL